MSSSTSQQLTPTTNTENQQTTGNIGESANAYGNVSIEGSTGNTITMDSAPALAFAGQAVSAALQGESQIASGALQFSSGLATQGANLAATSNPIGGINTLLKPILIVVVIVVVAYLLFK